MRRILLTTAIAIVTLCGYAQKFEGKITYEIKYVEMPEGMEQYVAMLPSESITYIKDNMSRIESSMGMGGSQMAISDSKNNSTIILMDMMGQKMMFRATEEDLKKQQKEAGKVKIEYTDETKKVAGYNVKRANITPPDSEDVIVVWYTEEIPSGSNKSFQELKGFPLEYEMNQQGMSMKYSAKEVSKENVPDEMFEVPEGYTEMSKEDLQKMMGGGGQ